MRILGIETGRDSGAAVVEDGRILAAVNEERLSRMKLVQGFPRDSIREVLALSGADVDDLDAVRVSGLRQTLYTELRPHEGHFQGSRSGLMGLLKRHAGRFSKYRNRLPFLETGYYALQAPGAWLRRRTIRGILREEFDVDVPIEFTDHHTGHLACAYCTSGFEDALVISLDGGGDGLCSRVAAVRNGRLEPLHEVSAYDSLGNWYAYVTYLCGFRAMKHEGKITGLAAYGEPRYVSLLREMIDEENGTFVNRSERVFMEAIEELDRRLPDGWKREDLAASIQQHFHDVVGRYVRHWARRSGLRDLALAGGVFANVRVNQVVHELPEVDRVFVHPHMSDGGLGAGAALTDWLPGSEADARGGEADARDRVPAASEPIPDVYLGRDLAPEEMRAALRDADLEPEEIEGEPEARIAQLLAEGYVVARAAGAMEYGPRALGNRSILYHPTDRSVNDWLNENLDRTEFMPFAPSVLYEARDRCFENVVGAEHTAEFMTMTFDCTPWMRRHMEGVVHLDGTARPHLVRRDRNPGLHRIIEAFEERTGLPGIINTSFNMHEEPIVCSAEDCVRAFLAGNLDYLALGPHLVKHPDGVRRRLTPVEPAGDREEARVLS